MDPITPLQEKPNLLQKTPKIENKVTNLLNH